MEERKIGVYIKVNENNEVVDIGSDIFIKDTTNWIKIDEGNGDKYAHCQNNYLPKSLRDEDGNYVFKYESGKIVESNK